MSDVGTREPTTRILLPWILVAWWLQNGHAIDTFQSRSTSVPTDATLWHHLHNPFPFAAAGTLDHLNCPARLRDIAIITISAIGSLIFRVLHEELNAVRPGICAFWDGYLRVEGTMLCRKLCLDAAQTR